jgi:glycerophosphoryl diester phosphodiesterase
LIISHRGSRSLFAENTLEAFEISQLWYLKIKYIPKKIFFKKFYFKIIFFLLDRGDIIEFDVRITLDDNLVVFHDDVLDRTTNGKGLVISYTTDQCITKNFFFFFPLSFVKKIKK